MSSDRAQEVKRGESRESGSLATLTRTLAYDQVAERAKRIWYERGCPQGEDERNWREAEKQLKREMGME